ncbi:MAG: hypothetical protein WBM62_18385 [Crocosphaera sp.]|jgi:hypothetical protein
MTDAQFLLLTSFITALKWYEQPLPKQIIKQLNDIGTDLENKVIELDAIAKSIPPLKDLYDKAFQSLLSRSAVRKMGQEFYPSDEEEEYPTIENITRDITSDVTKIEANLDNMIASLILSSDNPSEAARQQFN